MNTERCWEIVEAAREDVKPLWDERTGDDDTLDIVLSEALVARLGRLSPAEIVAFECRFAALCDRIAGRDGIHMAAHLIMRFVGDDGFSDFFAGLVGLGRHWYERVLENPDNLAEHPAVRRVAAGTLGEYVLLMEGVQFAASTAYEQLTGEDDAFHEHVERVARALADDLGPAPEPLPRPLRMPRLEAMFPANLAVLHEVYDEE
ncbi:hypothetical protein Val02_05500 [Virgisporangium aliadipatigenens]|uniref:DUF4240 domain-containing protein n=1 Tax=Virgisporangium aliadipatigenens TaxID=741659 RepID=A0A8J3YEH8_9ACTN|nr:DUF4240 domain-containing protein [Virgisporangium aliadipatigenens]GIJ43664.1 hypothetical protein Val02_05500 [Virgisporangium aliadipatigenens]